jgi:hypothetical protein
MSRILCCSGSDLHGLDEEVSNWKMDMGQDLRFDNDMDGSVSLLADKTQTCGFIFMPPA